MSNVPPYLPLATRDVRFDLFRGLANWAIFLDHIPHEVMSWITIKNYGFIDAADLFLFNAATLRAHRVAWRAFKLYVGHVLVVMIYAAVITWISGTLHDPEAFTPEDRSLMGSIPWLRS